MASGPYTNVRNTSVHQESVSGSSTITTVQVFAWDGDRPSIAQTWGPGSVLEIASLPLGATDPDIIVGDNGIELLVAYELNGNVEYQRYTNQVGGGLLTLAGLPTIIASASSPNLDKPFDCDDPNDRYALVYEDNTGASDISFVYGTFFGFITSTTAILPTVSLAPSADPYADRVNPDVMYVGEEVYVTAAGRNTNLGAFNVDVFYAPASVPFPSITGLLNPGTIAGLTSDVFPRIDGIFTGSLGCYGFSLVYEDNNLVYNAYNNSNFGVIQHPASNNVELPAVSYLGDYNDVIWTTNVFAPSSKDIIGLGAAGCAKDAFYKQVNAIVGSGMINLYPYISGNCSSPGKGNDYAMIWWEQNTANIYYKFAHGGTTSYKNSGERARVENAEIRDFPTLITSSQFNWESDSELSLEIRNLSGQLVGLYSLAEFKNNLAGFDNGLYIFKIIDKSTNTLEIKKVLIKS